MEIRLRWDGGGGGGGGEGGGFWMGGLHLSVVGYYTVILPVGSRLKFSIFVGCR